MSDARSPLPLPILAAIFSHYSVKQRELLEKLKDKGLKAADLQGRADFTDMQQQACIALVTRLHKNLLEGKEIDFPKTLDSIAALDDTQAIAVKEGMETGQVKGLTAEQIRLLQSTPVLTKSDVQGLNPIHCDLLKRHHAKGLAAENLRCYPQLKTEEQKQAFNRLLAENSKLFSGKTLSIQALLNDFMMLIPESETPADIALMQARVQAVKSGFKPRDLANLNVEQLNLLVSFRLMGLTPEELRIHNKSREQLYADAFRAVVTRGSVGLHCWDRLEKLSVVQVQHLLGTTQQQAQELGLDLTSMNSGQRESLYQTQLSLDEVEALENAYQMLALKALRSKTRNNNISARLLSNYPEFNSKTHVHCLLQLVIKGDGNTANNVLEEMKGLSEIQLQAVEEFEKEGLTFALCREHNANNISTAQWNIAGYLVAFRYFMLLDKKNVGADKIHQAIKRVDELNPTKRLVLSQQPQPTWLPMEFVVRTNCLHDEHCWQAFATLVAVDKRLASALDVAANIVNDWYKSPLRVAGLLQLLLHKGVESEMYATAWLKTETEIKMVLGMANHEFTVAEARKIITAQRMAKDGDIQQPDLVGAYINIFIDEENVLAKITTNFTNPEEKAEAKKAIVRLLSKLDAAYKQHYKYWLGQVYDEVLQRTTTGAQEAWQKASANVAEAAKKASEGVSGVVQQLATVNVTDVVQKASVTVNDAKAMVTQFATQVGNNVAASEFGIRLFALPRLITNGAVAPTATFTSTTVSAASAATTTTTASATLVDTTTNAAPMVSALSDPAQGARPS